MSADPNGPNDLRAVVDEVSSWLTLPADEVDRHLGGPEYRRVTRSVSALNHRASSGDADAFYLQQLLLGRIYGALEVLAFAPRIGRERAEFAGSPRSFSVRPYVIFYEPLPEGDGILVWRILHGARDLRPLVRPPSR